jgi:hypothetical protein
MLWVISYRFAVPDGRVLAELKERADRFSYEARMAGDILQIRDPNGCWLELEIPGKSKMDLSLLYPVDPKQLPKELTGVDRPPK